MGIITFFAMLLSAAILLLIFGIAFWKYSHKNCIYKRIKKRKSVIRISEADYSGEKSERTPAYRGESFLLQREQHYSSEELLRLTLSPQA